jgi:hypothetical protein
VSHLAAASSDLASSSDLALSYLAKVSEHHEKLAEYHSLDPHGRAYYRRATLHYQASHADAMKHARQYQESVRGYSRTEHGKLEHVGSYERLEKEIARLAAAADRLI